MNRKVWAFFLGLFWAACVMSHPAFAQNFDDGLDEPVVEVAPAADTAAPAPVFENDELLAAPPLDISRVPDDASAVEPRLASPKELESYRKKSRYRYDRAAKETEEEIEDIDTPSMNFDFLDALVPRNIDGSVLEFIFKFLAYSLFFVVLFFIVTRLLNINVQSLIRPKGQSTRLNFREEEEDVHKMDFNRLIQEALAQGQFRKAIRLTYLQTLKLMTDRELIQWRQEKTNRDYLRELKSADLRSRFDRLTLLFEIAWYSDRPVNNQMYDEAAAEFQDFQRQIK